jgi:hypothetical protein
MNIIMLTITESEPTRKSKDLEELNYIERMVNEME